MTQETAKGYAQFIIIIIFLLVIYLLNFVFALIKTEPKIQSKQNEIPIVSVITLPATLKKISFDDTAQITARTYIPIISEVTGRIISVSPSFKAGLCFKKNEILFTIDVHEIESQYETALAELKQAKATLSLVNAEADAAIAEWKILNPSLPIPLLVAKQPQIKQATANIETVQAKIKLAEVHLNQANFLFPFAGCVESSGVEIGQYANTGQS